MEMFNKLKRNKSFNVVGKSNNKLKIAGDGAPVNYRRTMDLSRSALQPHLLALRQNPLYKNQGRRNLERRLSVSLDDVSALPAQLRVAGVAPNLNHRKSRSFSSVSGYDAVLKEFKYKGKEFKRHLEKNTPSKSPTTSKFPVVDEDVVQIRDRVSNNTQPSRQTVHDFHASSRSTVIIPPDIIVRGPLKMKDGGSNKYEKGSITLKMEQSFVTIEDNKRKVIAKNLKIRSRTATSIELVDGTSGSDKVLYRIQVENENQIEDRQRRRSNSLNEKQETKRIQNILKNLIKRRSDRYLLEKKGIIKNEPIFGNTLASIYQNSKDKDAKTPVPNFVREIIKLIEIPKNMKSEHIYRISGNLATIQKIRLNLDKNKLEILKEFENETDVLTGTLKLFFRELKEPLIPRDKFAELHKLLHVEDEAKRNKSIRNVVNGIETPHKETLLALIDHLNKVVQYGEENKMSTHSLAIIWSPSLYWDEQPSNQMAFTFDVIMTVEFLLTAYKCETTTNETNRIENKLLAIGEESEDDEDEDEVKSSPSGIRRFFSPKRLISREFYGSNSSLNESKRECEAVSLETLAKRTNTNVPDLICRITEHIEKNLETKDLYARPENKDKSAKYKKKASKKKLDVSKIATHDLACFLMSFLKELNEPLVPVEVFNYFVDGTTTKADLEWKLGTLGDESRETLEHVLTHVLKVTDRSEINNMSKEKMIPIWAKTLYNSLDNLEYKKCNNLVTMLLDVYDDRRRHTKFAHNINIKTHHLTKSESPPARRVSDERPTSKEHKIMKGIAEDALKQKNERTLNNARQSTSVSKQEATTSDPTVKVKQKVYSWRLAGDEAVTQNRRLAYDNLGVQPKSFKAKNELKICDSASKFDGVKAIVPEDVAKRRNVDDAKHLSIYDNMTDGKTTD